MEAMSDSPIFDPVSTMTLEVKAAGALMASVSA